MSAMRSYFLNPPSPPPADLRVYVWPCAGRKQVILRNFGVTAIVKPLYESPLVGDLLKFFPLAFFVTTDPARPPGFRLGSLALENTNDPSELQIPLSGAPYSDWPERPRDNEALIISNRVGSVATKRDHPG